MTTTTGTRTASIHKRQFTEVPETVDGHENNGQPRVASGLVAGSLCTGYGGLDLGVLAAVGGRVAWVADPDPHITTILATRFPGVPNLGDITTVDWTSVPPVDVLTAGWPCQDISAAGRRAGITEGTRSGLWREVIRAVRGLRPSLLVVENVAALRWKDGGLDIVLGSLAALRYDAHWCSLRASDIGACHRRERVFVLAYPHDTRFGAHLRSGATHSAGTGRHPYRVLTIASPRASTPSQPAGHGCRPAATEVDDTVVHSGSTYGSNQRAEPTGVHVDVVADAAGQRQGHGRGPRRERVQSAPGPTGDPAVPDPKGQRHANAETTRRLRPPTTTVERDVAIVSHAAGERGRQGQREPARLERRLDVVLDGGPLAAHPAHWGEPSQPPGGHVGTQPIRSRSRTGRGDAGRPSAPRTGHLEPGTPVVEPEPRTGSDADWGPYEAAIRRWEHVLGRAAPHPTEPGRHGQPRLSVRFTEWLMGIPDGWVSDVDLPRSASLRALGNGVVPQQAACAVRHLLADCLDCATDPRTRQGAA